MQYVPRAYGLGWGLGGCPDYSQWPALRGDLQCRGGWQAAALAVGCGAELWHLWVHRKWWQQTSGLHLQVLQHPQVLQLVCVLCLLPKMLKPSWQSMSWRGSYWDLGVACQSCALIKKGKDMLHQCNEVQLSMPTSISCLVLDKQTQWSLY